MAPIGWLMVVGTVPWIFLGLAGAVHRFELARTPSGQTRVLVGSSSVLPALMAWWMLLLPIAVLVSLSKTVPVDALPGGDILAVVAAVLLLVMTLALGYACYRVLPRLRLPSRLVVDDEGIRLCWWWSRGARRGIRWSDPYVHELFLERHEVGRGGGARSTLWFENHRFQVGEEILWVRHDRGEPAPQAPSLPDDVPWLRPTIAIGRERARFLADPRIQGLRERYLQ